MAQGRDSASAGRAIATAFAVACCCCCILAGRGVADAAATYYVGDSNGWSFSSPSWPNGKHFHAGDTLVFMYIPWVHNVVAVDEDGYNGCTTRPGSRIYTSGSDSIRLAKGDNFFICTRFGHCNLGMKLVVYAA
uniref:Plantacyanin n=1 Tax=Arundo donax TaxID=35708 RepID=A0A0A8ZWP8_ARUDO